MISIFADGTYAKPFFLTYLNTSVFTLAALPNLLRTAWRVRKSGEWRDQLGWIRERYRRGAIRISNSTHPASTRRPTSQREFLAVLPTAKIALQFCPLWFSSNYLALACLEHTSVASTTVLSSTSSIWTLAIGALSGTEKFTLPKLISVMASLLGITLISRADLTTSADNVKAAAASSNDGGTLSPFPAKTPREIILGDAMALCSAILYGYYTVFLKRISTTALPLKINMSLLFGLMGLINIFLLAPLLWLVSVVNIEPFELPPTSQIWAIALINSTASLIGDVSWAHALVLTSPLVVTVGLSLTIPVSLVGEIFLQGRSESLVYWLGSFFVIGGFVFLPL
ncbi:hypothetical protein DV738_g5023, partial [Chaetothyriales sp. CBS 135597]